MSYKLFLLAIVLLSMRALSDAQSLPPGYVDPEPVLQAASQAIGADRLACVEFSGNGYAAIVGQGRTQEEDWPKRDLTQYRRTIHFNKSYSAEEFSREPGQNPRSWKYGAGWLGGTPAQRQPRQRFVVRGKHAWHQDGLNAAPIPAPGDAELWQLDIWLSPHGFLKAARMPGANPKAVWRWELVESGRDGATTGAIEKVTVVSITVLDKYRVNATINSKNMIQRIETKVPHPVLGDMNYEHEYSDWKEAGGVKFPSGWHHHQGYDDERSKPTISGGHNAFGGSFPDIKVNSCAEPLDVPQPVIEAKTARTPVNSRPLAKGVWLMGGSSHNSVAIEFDDFLAIVEAPLDEARSLAVIEEVVKLVPGKPIRWIVNTHDHYDHMGGLRTYLHIGATIVTHKRNRVFFEEEYLDYTPRTLEPDMMTLYQPTEIREGYVMEVVAENYVISDGKRNLHISYVQPLAHSEGMLMAYLPTEKMVIEADLYDSPGPGEPRPTANPSHRTLYDHVKRLGLDVETIVPIHGQPTPWPELLNLLNVAR